jgi:hypothetical protein
MQKNIEAAGISQRISRTVCDVRFGTDVRHSAMSAQCPVPPKAEASIRDVAIWHESKSALGPRASAVLQSRPVCESALEGASYTRSSTLHLEDEEFVAAAGLKDDRCFDTGDPRSVHELVERKVLQMLRVPHEDVHLGASKIGSSSLLKNPSP